MNPQESINFERISTAIHFIKNKFKEQPTLDDIAKEIHLSPFHFQRLFTEWAGTSPKKFLQYISIEYAKKMLKENETTLFDTAIETGLSGTSRLHDLFIKLEGMTPGEYKNGGEFLQIEYSYNNTLFGPILIGSTAKGICHIAFDDNNEHALEFLKGRFPNAKHEHNYNNLHQRVKDFFTHKNNLSTPLPLHIKGTDFQLKVWEALLNIPSGKVTTYGNIARKIKAPNSSRAVGTAIGSNPIAYLIPCHRVIQSSGILGGYRWGNIRKTAMIGWEAAQMDVE